MRDNTAKDIICRANIKRRSLVQHERIIGYKEGFLRIVVSSIVGACHLTALEPGDHRCDIKQRGFFVSVKSRPKFREVNDDYASHELLHTRRVAHNRSG